MDKTAQRVSAALLPAILIILPIMYLQHLQNESYRTAMNRIECRGNIRDVSQRIGIYLIEYGHFPAGGWDKAHSCPVWVWQLRSMFVADWGEKDVDVWMKNFKCPEDKSSSVTSYEMNPELFGKTPADIKSGKILILTEKSFKGSHKHVYRGDVQRMLRMRKNKQASYLF